MIKKYYNLKIFYREERKALRKVRKGFIYKRIQCSQSFFIKNNSCRFVKFVAKIIKNNLEIYFWNTTTLTK
ncbi:hypothetical protein DBR27_10960, partial [Flavobacterium sp. HMWF030]